MSPNTTRYARNCAITVTNGYLLTSARGSPGYSSRCARYATSRRKATIEPIVAKAIRSTSQPVHDGFSAIEVGAEGNGSGGGDGSTHGFGGDDKSCFLRYLNLHKKIASAPNPPDRAERLTISGFRKEFVLVDYRSHRDLAIRCAIVHAHYFALTTHANALGQGNLRREGKRKFDWRSSGNGRVQVKANTASAYIASLGGFFLRSIFTISNRNRQPQRESPRRPLFLSSLGHEYSEKSPVRIAFCVECVKINLILRCSIKIKERRLVRGRTGAGCRASLHDVTCRMGFVWAMVFVLDNYDSFTYNLVQYLGELGAEVVVRRNDQVTVAEVEAMKPERIVLSPGPCTPHEAGISIELIRQFAGKVPVLGVCLGHQAIGAAFGGRISRANHLMHGKTSQVQHDGKTIFREICSPITATRYHSLIVEEEALPDELEVSAWTTERDGTRVIMGLRHREFPIEGVQFHPESVLTNHGKKLIANFLAI